MERDSVWHSYGDRLLHTLCQSLAERQLKETDKDLIATFQPEQHAHEIKLNVISAPSQINLTVKESVWGKKHFKGRS